MSDNGGGEGSGSNRAVAVDDALERVGFGFGQYLILANMGVSLFGEGMQLVVVYYLGETLHQDLACSDFLVAWVDTAILAGLGVGCFIGGSCSDIFGRKPTLQVANLFAAILGSIIPVHWLCECETDRGAAASRRRIGLRPELLGSPGRPFLPRNIHGRFHSCEHRSGSRNNSCGVPRHRRDRDPHRIRSMWKDHSSSAG